MAFGEILAEDDGRKVKEERCTQVEKADADGYMHIVNLFRTV